MHEGRHVLEVRHHANGMSCTAVYAHCTCGWESGRCHLTGTELDGRDVAVAAAEVAGMRHVEQATSPRI
jgi:hypothetical protein